MSEGLLLVFATLGVLFPILYSPSFTVLRKKDRDRGQGDRDP